MRKWGFVHFTVLVVEYVIFNDREACCFELSCVRENRLLGVGWSQ